MSKDNYVSVPKRTKQSHKTLYGKVGRNNTDKYNEEEKRDYYYPRDFDFYEGPTKKLKLK